MSIANSTHEALLEQIEARRAGAKAEITMMRGEIFVLTQRVAALGTMLKSCEEAAAGLRGETMPDLFDPGLGRSPTVRELLLNLLRQAFPGGMTKAALNAALAGLGRRGLHPKTAGMTLTRLKMDGLARWDGEVWYATDSGLASEIG